MRTTVERLREHRLARNWTQAEVARRAGISLPTYQGLEAGLGINLRSFLAVLGALGFLNEFSELIPPPELTMPALLEQAKRRPRQRARPRA
jgi:transcriptional regulator with XRE-family HTH domain